MNEVAVRELMRWYADAGVDEVVMDTALDRFDVPHISISQLLGRSRTTPAQSPQPQAQQTQAQQQSSNPVPKPHAAQAPSNVLPIGAEEAIHDAVGLAAKANTVAELREALEGFDGCALKKTASNLVFVDGNPEAKVLFIGEGPGAEEDRKGIPFVSENGLLLDKMLKSIGLDREQVLLTNTVFWRPPGNRTLTPTEISICMPFVERLIEIVDPKIVVALGGAAAKPLLAQTQGIGRIRGRWFQYATPKIAHPIDAMAMFHPSYLLKSPAQKCEAWQDLLMLKEKLAEYS